MAREKGTDYEDDLRKEIKSLNEDLQDATNGISLCDHST